jgi:hypothetical protein
MFVNQNLLAVIWKRMSLFDRKMLADKKYVNEEYTLPITEVTSRPGILLNDCHCMHLRKILCH